MKRYLGLGSTAGRRWLTVGLLFAGLFVVVVGPWRQSWFNTLVRGPGAHQSANRSKYSPEQKSSESRRLQAGASAIEINDLLTRATLAGYGKRAFKRNSGSADPLRISALVLSTGDRKLAIITGDLLLVNLWLADAVLEELHSLQPDWLREELYFGASHTHSGPGGFAGRTVESIGMGVFDPVIANALAKRMAAAVVEARSQLTDTEWRHSAVEADANTVVNRTRAGGRTNRWLDFLEFRAPGGSRRIASLAVFGAHATCRPSDDDRLSGDYPGALTRSIEAEFGGVALFLAGGVGSQAPGDIGVRETRDRSLADTLLQSIRRLTESPALWRQTADLRTAARTIILPAPQVKVAGEWRVSPIASGLLLPTRTAFWGFGIDDVIFIGAPADLNGPIAAELRSLAGAGTTVIATSFAGDYIGYIIDDADYNLDKYEPRQMALYGSEASAGFREDMLSLANFLTQK